MAENLNCKSRRTALRRKISNTFRGRVQLTLEELEYLSNDYEEVIEECNALFPEEMEVQLIKDDNYRDQINGAIDFARTTRRISAINPIIDEDLFGEENNEHFEDGEDNNQNEHLNNRVDDIPHHPLGIIRASEMYLIGFHFGDCLMMKLCKIDIFVIHVNLFY